MRKNISSIIMIGSVWGAVEATIGHFLHVFTLGIGWLLWFPVAFFFLNTVYRMTEKTSSILYTAIIAAGIKMIDIFYTPRYDYVINPSVSILLEALAVFVVCQYFMKQFHAIKLNLITIVFTSLLWKVFYICYLLFLPESWIRISCLSGLIPFSRFLFLETGMNTLVIGLSVFVFQKVSTNKLNLSSRFESLCNHRFLIPSLSFLTLLLAVIVQIKL